MSHPTYTFRNSSVSNYITCPAKFYFGWIKNLQPVDKNINLEFGSSVHLGAETFFKLVKLGEDPAGAATKDKAITTFIQNFTAKDFEHHVSKNIAIGSELLGDLFEKYYDLKPEEILAVEKRFVRRLKGYEYTGKIDLLLKRRGQKIIVDHKTAGKLGSNITSKWQLARQFIGYKWLTDADDVLVNLMHCIKGNGSTTFPMVYQIPLLFSDFKLKRWEYQTAGILDDMASRLFRLQAHVENKRFPHVPDILFPRFGTMCNIYGCEFESLCSQDLPITEIITPIGMFIEKEES